jgi:hypothetical protein
MAAVFITPLTGCGGGGSSSGGGGTTGNNGSAAAKQEVTAGQQQMNALLTGQQATSSSSVSAVNQTFQTAYTDDPTNAQAAFGYAITLVASSAETAQSTLQIRSASPGSLSGMMQSITLRNLGSLNLLSRSSIQGLLGAPVAQRAITRGPSPSQIRAAISQVQSTLDTALPILDIAALDSSFSFIVKYTNPSTGVTSTINIDQADVLTIDSALYLLDGMLEMALSYNFGPGTFDFTQSINSVLGAKISAGTTINASDYLPPAPFGSPTSDSRSRFAAAKVDINTSVTRARSAVAAYSMRTSQTGHLFNPTNFNATVALAAINTFSADFNSPFTVPLAGSTVTINIQAWFVTQPDFRALQPQYHPIRSSGGVTTIVAVKADYPDPSFGGLVSNVPANVYSANLSVQEPVFAMYVPFDLITGLGSSLL